MYENYKKKIAEIDGKLLESIQRIFHQGMSTGVEV